MSTVIPPSLSPTLQEAPPNREDAYLTIYKAYLNDLGRIGSRQETARQLYISLISALFVFLSLTGSTGALFSIQRSAQILVGVTGASLCALWAVHMRSFRKLFDSKFVVLQNLETQLKLSAGPFTMEHSQLDSNGYVHVTSVDTAVAIVLTLLFIALVYFKG